MKNTMILGVTMNMTTDSVRVVAKLRWNYNILYLFTKFLSWIVMSHIIYKGENMYRKIYELLHEIAGEYCRRNNIKYTETDFPDFMEWFYFQYVDKTEVLS